MEILNESVLLENLNANLRAKCKYLSAMMIHLALYIWSTAEQTHSHGANESSLINSLFFFRLQRLKQSVKFIKAIDISTPEWIWVSHFLLLFFFYYFCTDYVFKLKLVFPELQKMNNKKLFSIWVHFPLQFAALLFRNAFKIT